MATLSEGQDRNKRGQGGDRAERKVERSGKRERESGGGERCLNEGTEGPQGQAQTYQTR